MKTTTMSPTALAHHLRVAADQYDRDKQTAVDAGVLGIARTFDDQAKQARQWADALENVNSLGFEGDDIDVGHD